MGVIGHPVRHSLSPRLHNAAFRALDLDWVYLAFEVGPGAVPAALAAVRALDLAGLNVTMPHKADVAAGVDRLSPAAAALGAVNTVVNRDGELVGENTDGDGFVASLRESGFEPAGRRCLVVGAGGAARAVVRALGEAGAERVSVWARREDAARMAAALTPAGRPAPLDEAADADLVVNATPLGMGTDTRFPLDPDLLHPGQTVVDLIYDPQVTPLLAEAARRGAVTVNGVGMLVHQAALSFRLWTGRQAPVDAMRAGLARAADD